MVDVARLIAQLADAGLDLVHAFDAHAVGALAIADAEEQRTHSALATNRDGSPRPVLARATHPLAKWEHLSAGPRVGLLVGNTRALWPHVLAARAGLPDHDPLDAYVERTIARVVGATSARADDVVRGADEHVDGVMRGAGGRTDAAVRTAGDPNSPLVVFTHRRYDGAYLPFQELAFATGFAAPSAGGLAVHPVYGPWFALRAVIALDLDTASLPAPQHILPAPQRIAKPCVCDGACETALEIARADLGNWRAWLAVRDACSLREHRYSDEQIRFHYASAWPSAARDE